MKVKKYEGRTWEEAFRRMKEDLGHEAVIVYTYVPPKRGLMRILGKQRFMIVAGKDLNMIQTSPNAVLPLKARQGDTTRLIRTLETGKNPVAEPDPISHSEVKAIREKLNDLYEVVRRGDLHICREELMHAYLAMVKTQVSSVLARRIVARIEQMLSAEQVRDGELVKRAIRNTIGEMIQVSGPIQLAHGRCKTIAIVGPTGVGKTTTIAKLAANFALREEKRVALISIDTYRIAAPEQLSKLAEIMRLPIRIVGSPEELREAVRSFRHYDLVLIDTAGRSQKDDPRLEELRQFLDAAQPDEVHLALSATWHPENAVNVVEKFGRFRIDAIILTKLDESVRFGLILDILSRVHKSVSYITTGQNVATDISEASQDHLTNLILGEG